MSESTPEHIAETIGGRGVTAILYIAGATILYLTVAWLLVGTLCRASARADAAIERMTDKREEKMA